MCYRSICKLILVCLCCFFASVCFVSMAAPTWKDALVAAGLTAGMADMLIDLGYADKGVFVSALVSEQATEKFIKFVLVEKHLAGESITADIWEFHPVAGKLRALWRATKPKPASGAVPWPNRRSRSSQCQA